MERIPVSVMTVMSDKGIEPFRVEFENKEGLHKISIKRILLLANGRNCDSLPHYGWVMMWRVVDCALRAGCGS